MLKEKVENQMRNLFVEPVTNSPLNNQLKFPRGKLKTYKSVNESTTYKSLVRLAHCERHGYSLCISVDFMVQTSQILTDAGRGKACSIFKREHLLKSLPTSKIGKEH